MQRIVTGSLTRPRHDIWGTMIDPAHEAILIRDRQGFFVDKTLEVVAYRIDGPRVLVTFPKKTYPFSSDRVRILQDPEALGLQGGWVPEIEGEERREFIGAIQFRDASGDWYHFFTSGEAAQRHGPWLIAPAHIVRWLADPLQHPQGRFTWDYLKRVAANLEDIDGTPNPLIRVYDRMTHVPSGSVLSRYLTGTSNGHDASSVTPPPVFPIGVNTSQREAIRAAWQSDISVIEGPPGTGKTQTIVNLLATLLMDPEVTIGVVSANNSAVDNVREKLDDLGVGFLTASLGNRARSAVFYAPDRQRNRNLAVDAFVTASVTMPPSLPDLNAIDGRIRLLQEREREVAHARRELDAHEIEYQHFLSYLSGHDVANVDGIRLTRQDAHHILTFLADTHIDPERHPASRWVRRLGRLLRYGSLRGADPSHTDTVLALQNVYYTRRIAELRAVLTAGESALAAGNLPQLLAKQRNLSVTALHAAVRARYTGTSPTRQVYDERKSRRQRAAFVRDYPVLLSTCQSLPRSLGDGRLLDYLIVDEASQADLLSGGAALACARRVIVVGDLAQLSHIPDEAAASWAGAPPLPAYNYREHSLLSSLHAVYGTSIPRTLLREHYRCDPTIIGFCNDKFYGGALIPYTASVSGSRPLVIHRTAAGNHMRVHSDGGSRSNLREVEAIRDEVIAQHCNDLPLTDIGFITPYSRQVAKLRDELADRVPDITAGTVHRFQGREKRAIVFSTVLDETTAGHKGLGFVDEPRLINVAVSRAAERFVLVTDHDMLPRSRHLRDLIAYTDYHFGDRAVHNSSIVSVFDLLYSRYSAVLRPLAARVRRRHSHLSEDIVDTVLREVLAEPPFTELQAHPQVLLQNLLPSLAPLTPEEHGFVTRRASVDFLVVRPVTRRPVLVIEVDGFAFHEDDPRQLRRDQMKDAILARQQIPVLRLSTTGSNERERIRAALREAFYHVV